jgi:hypothetical protein
MVSSEEKGTLNDLTRYIHEVIEIDPNDAFELAGRPRPSRLAQDVRNTIDPLIPHEIPRLAEVGNETVSMIRVMQDGLDDTMAYLGDAFMQKNSQLTPELAAQIIHAPSTIHVLAGLALQAGGKENENADMTPNYRHQFGLNKDLTAIEPGRIFITDKNRGCPFAGRNGEIRPTGLFTKFGIWSGTLAVHAYFNHFHHIDPTDVLRSAQQ